MKATGDFGAATTRPTTRPPPRPSLRLGDRKEKSKKRKVPEAESRMASSTDARRTEASSIRMPSTCPHATHFTRDELGRNKSGRVEPDKRRAHPGSVAETSRAWTHSPYGTPRRGRVPSAGHLIEQATRMYSLCTAMEV